MAFRRMGLAQSGSLYNGWHMARNREERKQNRRRTPPPIYEEVIYPKVDTETYQPCTDPNTPFEHVLKCKHLITTPEPDEPCAPNCYHVFAACEKLNSRLAPSARKQNTNAACTTSYLPFYCDACTAETAEKTLSPGWTSQQAHDQRQCIINELKSSEIEFESYRSCYIAQKTVRVPCDANGSPKAGYVPRVKHHPFDTARPQSGDDMFEGTSVDGLTKEQIRQGGELERDVEADIETEDEGG